MRGQITYSDIKDTYIKEVIDSVEEDLSDLKVVLDSGNGVAGHVAPDLFKKLGCEVIELYSDVDGNFPNHHPDPGKLENLQDIISEVKKQNADIGFAFDGDGDRVGLITNKGEMNGGDPIMSPTGHFHIKNAIKKNNALLGGEMSGHIFFNDKWYGFDDGPYSAVRAAEILVKSDDSISDIFSRFPNSFSTPELNINVTDENKFEIVKKFISESRLNGEKITIDGLRVNFDDGWGLLRASNTTPKLVLRFEGDSFEAMNRIQDEFISELSRICPDIDINLD